MIIQNINNDVVYMKIPSDYYYVYEQLLKKMTSLGTTLLNDCSSTCKTANKQITICWNMFQAACAAYNNGENKKADLLIKYIVTCLNIKTQDSFIIYIILSDTPLNEYKTWQQCLNNTIPNQTLVVGNTVEVISDNIIDDSKRYFSVIIPTGKTTLVYEENNDLCILDDGFGSYTKFNNKYSKLFNIDGIDYDCYEYYAPASSQKYKFKITSDND